MARSANPRRFTLQFGSKKYADFGRCKMRKRRAARPVICYWLIHAVARRAQNWRKMRCDRKLAHEETSTLGGRGACNRVFSVPVGGLREQSNHCGFNQR